MLASLLAITGVATITSTTTRMQTVGTPIAVRLLLAGRVRSTHHERARPRIAGAPRGAPTTDDPASASLLDRLDLTAVDVLP